jgi:hypothetical protein
MKEHPILFNAPMVRALLDGSKTQTRRVVRTPASKKVTYDLSRAWVDVCQMQQYLHVPFQVNQDYQDTTSARIHCPYGQSGDRLWVRETWCCDDYRVQSGPYLEVPGAREALFYRADNEYPFEAPEGKFWKPSIHIPRWASRILLEVVSVRVERLQDISEADAIAEGIDSDEDNYGNGQAYCDYRAKNQEDIAEWLKSPLVSYRTLWESINGTGS